MSVKLAVIYYSSTGTNYQLAQWAKEGAEELGAEVKVLKVPELAPQAAIDSNPAWKANHEATKDVPEVQLSDLEWADAYIFSVPTRFGNMASQMRQFLDTTGGLWFRGKLANKVVSAMTSAQNPHGGKKPPCCRCIRTCTIGARLLWLPGYTDPSIFAAGGNPYGTSVSVDQEGKMVEDVEAAVKYQAKRTVTVAKWLKQGKE